MDRKKLNCIRGRSRQRFPGLGGLLALVLVALMLAAPALAAGGQGVVPLTPLANKPEVTIQGNVVVDENGAPTGFYELALCVRSPRRIYGPDPASYAVGSEKELSEAEYARVLADIEAGTIPAGVDENSYSVTYYPFSAASAVVGVNTDVLTAVNWDVESVTYSEWNGTNYVANDTDYPRGIDLTPTTGGNFDPDVWDVTDPAPFPDVTRATLQRPNPLPVALDAEGDRSAFTAAAQVDHYYENPANNTKAALVTLSAHAPDNKPVIFKTSTPVAVVRFSYDLKRFPKNVVMVNETFNDTHVTDQITGANDSTQAEGFWLGLDQSNAHLRADGKMPLTWLADTAMGTGGNSFDFSDELAAATEAGQVVWTKLSSKDTAAEWVDWQQTEYYYYLGARTSGSNGTDGTVKISTDAGIREVENVHIPDTKGAKILAPGMAENPQPGAGDAWSVADYSYYTNLLYMDGARDLRLKLVNATTFRAPRGGKGGNQILFYDWDDTLIGALIVGKGDVRKDVNDYVEKNLVHPDLRAGKVLSDDLGGVVPDYSVGAPAAGSAEETYYNLVNSLDREYTYRGQYPSTPSPEGTTAGTVSDGEEYPLSNKLDYVFYKHLNTVTTVETQDAGSGKLWTENYFTLTPLTDDAEAAKYPWAYGWAIVEDAVNQKMPNKTGWPVMVDSVKLSNTWTTFGVGELEGLDPAAGNVYSAFATPAAGTTMESVYPGGLSDDWSADVTKDPATLGYTYQTSSADADGYLRFADFSDMSTLLKDGQDVIIVKAVYEPGTELDVNGNYTVVDGSLDVRRYSTTSSTENGIYSFAFQYKRAGVAPSGNMQGVRRVREPAVKTGFIFDAKSVDETVDLSKQGTFYLKNLATTGEIVDVDLTTGGDLWRMEYTLVDIYAANVGSGKNRSGTSDWQSDIKDNFLYDEKDPKYDERQGTDGFVTQLTLRTLLEEATKAARGEENSFSGHMTLSTLRDLNFKRAMGDPPVEFNFANAGNVSIYLQDLVQRLYDDKVSIDPKTGDVTLTWHQIQRHILMCEAANPGVASAGIYSGGTLMSDGQCKGFAWCRMDDCAGDVKMDINSVNDVLKALHMINTLPSTDKDYKKAYEAIYGDGSPTSTGVTGATLYGYGFRQHADGVPYNATDPNLKDTILNDLKDAVAILTPTLGTNPDWSTVTWTQLQEAIIKGNMGAATPPTLNLWWQATASAPNGTPPSINNWDDLWKYSIHTTLGVDMDGNGTLDAVVPDAFDNFDQTALDALVSEKPGTSTAANLGWFRTGVVSTVDGEEVAEKFTADAFRTAWAKALKALTSAPAPYTAATISNATWEEIQYALINGKYKPHMDIVNDTSIDYWWKNGGSPKLTFAKLLDAVNDFYVLSDSTKLDDILKSGPNPINNEMYLRKDSDGTEFETANDFKVTLQDALSYFSAFVYNPSDFLDSNSRLDANKVDEYVLQYILIHYNDFANGTIDTVPDKAAIKADTVNNDYWWFAGGVPTKPMPMRSVKDLFKAYLWYKGNTSTGVSGQNAQALGNLDTAALTAMGLRSDDWGVAYDGGATNAQLIAVVEKALAKLPYNMKAINSISEADLALEVQYLLANPTAGYQSAGVLRGQNVRYWWQEGDKSYPAPTNQKEVLEAVWKAYVGTAAGKTVPEAETALKALDIDFITKRNIGLAMRKDADGNAFANAGAFYTALTKAADAMKAGGQSYADLGNITQRQLQWMLLGNAYDTDANIQDATIDKTDPANPVDAYWWFTSDKKPSTEPTKKEKPIDPAKWSTFIQAVNDYAMLGDTTAFDNGTITLGMVNDDLLLRKADGSKFADWSEVYDGSYGEIIVNALYAIMTDMDKYAEFWDPDDGVTMVNEISWYEFQYAIIHTDEINASCEFPDLADCKQESEDKYDWKYETTGGEDPEPVVTEKPIDAAKWSTFVQGLNDYAMLGDTTVFDDGTITLNMVNDDLLLRKADGSEFADWSEVYDGSYGEIIINAYYAIMTDMDKYAEFWDPNDGVTLVKEPTWYEIQYAIIHTDEINMNCVFPSLSDCQAESEEKYTWRYEVQGEAPPAPTKKEKPIDAAKWSTFIQGLNLYAMMGDPADFDGGPLTNALSMINDDLLLRKADGSEFADWSEVYTGNYDEVIVNAFYAIMTDMDKYAEFWDQDDGVTLVKEPTWYEFQYAIIHTDEINANCIFPSLEDCKADCEANYDWKYTIS